MTKKDIVKTIAGDADLTQLKVKEIVQRTFDEIIETLVRDGKIELRNFGVFKVTKRAARPARNPRTSDPVYVPAKCVVTFKPGKEMAARIRKLTDVPGTDMDLDIAVETGQLSETLEASPVDSPTAGPSASPSSSDGLSAPPASPAIPSGSEIGTAETETSFNQLTGD